MSRTLRMVICLVTMLVATLGYAQVNQIGDYLPEGKVWKGGRYLPAEIQIEYTVSGDTVLGGKTCKKIYSKDGSSSPHFLTAMYQDGQKIYNYNGEGFEILYDFGLRKGESFSSVDGHKVVIELVDTIESDGILYQRQLLHDASAEDSELSYEVWIEGIGNRYRPTIPYLFDRVGSYYYLTSVWLDGVELFDFNTFGIFDAWTLPVEGPKLKSASGTGPCYDISGRRLQTPARNQLYIQNGRKYVGSVKQDD